VDLPRLEALTRYWKWHPPMHFLMAAYVGYKGPEDEAPQGDLQELLNMFPQKQL